MSQPFLMRKATPWHDSIFNSWPTHPGRHTHTQIFVLIYACEYYHIYSRWTHKHIQYKTTQTHTQLTCRMCCNTPKVCSQQYFMMDTVTVCLPWCKNVMLRSPNLSWIQINADMNHVELSDTELSSVLIGLFVDLLDFYISVCWFWDDVYLCNSLP